MKQHLINLNIFTIMLWSKVVWNITLNLKDIKILINPQFYLNVSTNIGKIFFRLLDKRFPKTHQLHKLFNYKNVKFSYTLQEKQNFCKNAKRKYHIFLILRKWRKCQNFRKTKIKENIIFSIFLIFFLSNQ